MAKKKAAAQKAAAPVTVDDWGATAAAPAKKKKGGGGLMKMGGVVVAAVAVIMALGGGGALALMESDFMVTRPGAEAQAFHRDVAPGVVSASSLAASLQVALVDTCAEQGVLEVRLSPRGSALWMLWQLLPGLPLGVEMQGPRRERRLCLAWPCPLGEPRLAPLRPRGA